MSSTAMANCSHTTLVSPDNDLHRKSAKAVDETERKPINGSLLEDTSKKKKVKKGEDGKDKTANPESPEGGGEKGAEAVDAHKSSRSICRYLYRQTRSTRRESIVRTGR